MLRCACYPHIEWPLSVVRVHAGGGRRDPWRRSRRARRSGRSTTGPCTCSRSDQPPPLSKWCCGDQQRQCRRFLHACALPPCLAAGEDPSPASALWIGRMRTLRVARLLLWCCTDLLLMHTVLMIRDGRTCASGWTWTTGWRWCGPPTSSTTRGPATSPTSSWWAATVRLILPR